MALTSDERRRQALLEWLFDQGSGQHHVNPFYEDVDRRMIVAFEDLEDLKWKDYARVQHSGGGENYAELTSEGRAAVERLREMRADLPARNRACRRAILRWLYSVRAFSSAGSGPEWEGFLADPGAAFCGESFDAGEVDANAAWLSRQGYIEGPPVGELEGPAWAYLTDKGVDCVENAEGDPQRYVSAAIGSRPRGDTHVNIHGGNFQIATGPGSSQTMEIRIELQKIEGQLDNVVAFVELLGVGDLSEIRALKDEALAELQGDSPSAEKAVTFGERVKALVGKSANLAATSAITTLTTDAVNSAVHLAQRLVS